MEGKPERILTVLIFIKLKISSLILSHMFLFKILHSTSKSICFLHPLKNFHAYNEYVLTLNKTPLPLTIY